ncbi:MAG: EAL domain-containing protein [Parvibaculaceae bacterium]|nr:EAL domain-containing protein [Parvibaculaceae bacterium]
MDKKPEDTNKGSSGFFEFEPEPAFDYSTPSDEMTLGGQPLKILSVDDDETFQNSLRLSLSGFFYRGSKPQFLTARSATQAARILADDPDISVILLDVVMETDDAGLRLVRNIREMQGNADIRIVLLTGQPGMAPMRATLEQLDISDYWLKTDITNERLQSIVVGNLRTWEQIRSINRARHGLQSIVEASNSLARAAGMEDFSRRVIHELAQLFGVSEDGIVCVRDDQPPHSARIIGSAGRFARVLNQTLETLDDTNIREALAHSLREQTSIATAHSQVLFFEGTELAPHTAAYLATGRHLDDTERELLEVFATNISTGLVNIALTSRLNRIAYEDDLLDMPNRNTLRRVLESAIEITPPRNRTMMMIELNQYSRSCISLGIKQGNLMLQAIANRLNEVFPKPCIVARLHEDTFAILGPSNLMDAEKISQLEKPSDASHGLFLDIAAARLDLDRFPGPAEEAIAAGLLLVKRARPGEAGHIVHYDPDVEEATSLRFALSRDLYEALQSRQLEVALQPQVDLLSHKIIGAEVLARWTRPNGVVVPPCIFIPIAEANGLIVPLGRLVVEYACEALVALDRAGHTDLLLSVNVSALQLGRTEFAAEMIDAVTRHGLSPARLELEITESVAMEGDKTAGSVLASLRAYGFPVSIDDFGTGYSSLKTLQSLKVSKLKIDRSFIESIGRTEEDNSITDMMIQLGHRLKMTVLAEGIETEAQATWLLERGCDLSQGYLTGRPEPLSAFMTRLAS